MVIKRVTIELDDASDLARSTDLPASLIVKKEILSEIQSTGTPEQQEDYYEPETLEKDQGSVGLPETIGRTPSDLVFTFINRPEFMATVLTFLALLIFANKLHSLADFWQPVVSAIILNVVWFGVEKIRRVGSSTKKK